MKPRSAASYFLWSSVLTIIALLIVLMIWPRVLSTFVSVKFGEPRFVCLGTQAIEFSTRWNIELLDRGDERWPLMFGVLPVPRSIAQREDRKVFLHLTSARATSFAATSRPRTFDQDQSLLDCQKSDACSLVNLNFGDQYRALVVGLDNGYSAILLDVPLHVIVKGSAPSAPVDLRLRTCTQSVKSRG